MFDRYLTQLLEGNRCERRRPARERGAPRKRRGRGGERRPREPHGPLHEALPRRERPDSQEVMEVGEVMEVRESMRCKICSSYDLKIYTAYISHDAHGGD